MSLIETMYLCIGLAAAVAVLGPQRRRGNTNPRPTRPRPPTPPSPPRVRR